MILRIIQIPEIGNISDCCSIRKDSFSLVNIKNFEISYIVYKILIPI